MATVNTITLQGGTTAYVNDYRISNSVTTSCTHFLGATATSGGADTIKPITPVNAAKVLFDNVNIIAQNSDIGELIKTPGIYYCQNSTVAATLTNAPQTDVGFSMMAWRHSSGNYAAVAILNQATGNKLALGRTTTSGLEWSIFEEGDKRGTLTPGGSATVPYGVYAVGHQNAGYRIVSVNQTGVIELTPAGPANNVTITSDSTSATITNTGSSGNRYYKRLMY